MTEDFSQVFARAQALQRMFNPCYMNSFSVVVKYDSYYGEYMEIELKTDNDKFFITTLNCVNGEDYEIRLNELERTLSKLIAENDD